MPQNVLASLNPFSGEMDHEAVVLRTLRLSLCMCVLLIPAFGVVFAVGGVLDVLWIRVVASGLAILILALTYVSERVRAYPLPILMGYLGVVMLWIGGLTVLNHLAPEAAVGFLFTLFGSGSLLGVASRKVRPLAWFLTGCSALGVAVGLASQTPGSEPAVFILSACATSLVLALVSYARIREQEVREERDRTLQESEHLALMGSWSHDLKTSRRKWSEGMYRLVGLSPGDGEPPQVFDFARPEDREGLIASEKAIMSGEGSTVDHRFSIVRHDGAERMLHSIVRLVKSDTRPVRVVGVVMDITDQAAHEEELVQARAAAEDAAALQKSILANMSHEIRTPLTAVIGYAQLLEEEAGDDIRELVVPIRTGGERLLDTLNSVLDLARMDAGQMEITAESLDVTAEIKKVIELLQQQAASRGLILIVDAPEVPVYALADVHALGRSLTNLIANAIKFTAEGSVTIHVSREDEHVRIAVADTGRGMSEEFQRRMFEPFRQESTGTSRSHEGTGLGLAITQRLVAAMGSSITVDSVEGRGTTFSFVLPAVTAPPPQPEPMAWIALPHQMRASGAIPETPALTDEVAQRGDGHVSDPPVVVSGSVRGDV